MSVLLRLFLRALVGQWATLALALASMAAFVVLGLAAWASGAAGRLVDAVGEDVTVTAFLNPTLDEAATTALLETLARRDDVAFVRYQSPTHQRARLVGVLGEEVVALVEPDLIPAGGAVDIGLRLGDLDAAALDRLREGVSAISSLDGVDAVPWRPEAVAAIVELVELTSGAGPVGALLMLLLAGGVAAAWSRGAGLRHAHVLALMHRFGATTRQREAPFVLAAVAAGLVAGLLAMVAFTAITDAAGDVLALLPGGEPSGRSGLLVLLVLGAPLLAGGGAWLGLREVEARVTEVDDA
jgi:cell division protein FtsX